MRTKLTICLLSLFAFTHIYAQQGTVRGSIFDGATGEYLPGVAVIVVGTTVGTTTDLDGKFNLEYEAGTCNLNISFISYENLTINDVEIKAGGVTLLENIQLKEATFELAEVTVKAQAVRNTEAALFTIKKKSPNVIDGISSSSFRRIGDADAASSMKRVPGVSVQGGKYVYVRGLGDRYTKTILNGVDIPGLDPDRNTLQMDLFPTNVIDNIIVHKSFSADLPADFTGGVIDINTKDFPEEKIGSVSLSIGYNPSMHFNRNYLSYKGGSTDFLGFDDGTRTIPATSDIPFYTDVIRGGINSAEAQRYREILEGFSPVMAAREQNNFMDYSVGFTFGNQSVKEKVTLGYNLSISYKNETEFFKDAEFGRYGLLSDPDIYEMEVREFQKGDYGVSFVLWSGMAGFAVKTKKSKYRINLLHLQNGESKAGIFDFNGRDQGSIFDGLQHNLDYNQRSLSNLIIDGKHTFGEDNWDLEWKLSPTLALMDDPDIRFTRYKDGEGEWTIGTEVGFPERIWRALDEINIAGLANATKNFDVRGEMAKLKFGGAYTYKERNYEILSYALNIRNIPLTGDPDELFWEENLWPYQGDINRGTTYEARFVPSNPNEYNSYTSNIAGYASVEMGIFNRMRAILGLRFENYTQHYTGENQQGDIVLNNEEVLNDFGLFPSINFIYTLRENQNLRLSYSKTIARPSFKELSYSEIYDPITGRTFVGGLFRDANDAENIEYWNGNLVSTDIHNFDLRWELFARNGQFFSVSGFYKRFLKPIEMVQYFTQTGAFQPRNVGDGEVYGAEAETRVNLDFITETLKSFGILVNFTYTESRVRLSSTEYQSRVENARTGQTIEEYRDMAGQAPYIVNAGLTYNGGEKGFWDGFEAGIYYNVQGQTLTYVGIVDRPDIYTEPFNSLNFNSNKKFGKEDQFQLGLKVENILNEDVEVIYKSYEAENQYFTRLSPGMKFRLRFSFNF